MGRIVLLSVLALVVVACGPTPEDKVDEWNRRGIHCLANAGDRDAMPWDLDNIDMSSDSRTVVPYKDRYGVKGKIVLGSIEEGYHSVQLFYSLDGEDWKLFQYFTYSNATCDVAPRLPYKDSRDNA